MIETGAVGWDVFDGNVDVGESQVTVEGGGGGGEEGEQADEEEVGEEEHGREEHCYLKELSPVLVERHIGSRCENVERESKKGGQYSVPAHSVSDRR